jgi:hypothetical protein
MMCAFVWEEMEIEVAVVEREGRSVVRESACCERLEGCG